MKRIQSHTNMWLKRKTLKSSKRRPCRFSDHNLRTIPNLWFSTYSPLERRCEFPNRLLCCCSVTQLCSTLCDPMACSIPGFPVLHYFLEFSQAHILSQWCHPTISSSAAPFSCPQSFPASEPFPMSQLFASGGQSIEASASASILPMSTQGWFPLGLIGLISLQPKGLSRVFSSTPIRKHHFSSTQPSIWSTSHICTWLLEKP